ncbi:chemotaxis protein CheB [Rhodanobacter aciditrophus]|uniref:chemotaxis protein CheB n=1 Tax=Rhodanobacter aciditrophus TaxID=1623218 RepID=UPI003CEC2130
MKRPAAIVLGCSAGGPEALKVVLGGLDPRLPQVVLACCHTGSETAELLCELLARASRLPVIEAAEREPARGGVVQVAPAGYHLLVERDLRFTLSVDPRVNMSRPSIDVLFASAAAAWRQALVGVVLSGANADGAEGLRELRRLGGCAIVQSPDSALAPAMPQAAIDRAGADHCVPLDAIAPLLNQLCLP